MSLWLRLKKYISVRENITVGEGFHIGFGSIVSAHNGLEIGDDVYIGKYCTIQCNGKIGRGTMIANNVGIVGRRDHNFRDVGKLISRAAWIGTDKKIQSDPKSAVTIEEDIWIGYGSVILSGITIGRGAIIAAGSVVSTDIAPYDIVSGNPAKKVGRRFPDEATIQEHERLLDQGGR